MKTLLIFAPTMVRADRAEQQRREAADECPRKLLLEAALNADVLDGTYLQSLSWLLRAFYMLLPAPVFQALEAYRCRCRYDAVVSWDDRFSLVYAFLLRGTRSCSRHVAILSWMAPPKKALLLKWAQKGIDRIIVWSQTHRELLIEFCALPPAKIVEIPYFVDQQFWRPIGVATQEGICSAGDSRRDYATLIEAVRDLPIRCDLATQVTPTYQARGDWGVTSQTLAAVGDLPGNVTLGPASPTQLRALYAHSRFVVASLFPSFRDNGVTTVAEAMAMGKAVICSQIYGQRDFIDEGVNGLFVPPGDAEALRDAIEFLWAHPQIAEQMGAEGRRRAEEIFALDHFVANVRQVVEDVITSNRTHIRTAAEQLQSSILTATTR